MPSIAVACRQHLMSVGTYSSTQLSTAELAGWAPKGLGAPANLECLRWVSTHWADAEDLVAEHRTHSPTLTSSMTRPASDSGAGMGAGWSHICENANERRVVYCRYVSSIACGGMPSRVRPAAGIRSSDHTGVTYNRAPE